MDNELIFRQAQSCETDRIMQIIRQAQARMHAAGSRQWQDGYPAPGHISADIGRNRGYVLCKPGVEGPLSVIAYGAVVFDGEPAYDAIDGQWLTDEPYVLVHRIAVADGERAAAWRRNSCTVWRHSHRNAASKPFASTPTSTTRPCCGCSNARDSPIAGKSSTGAANDWLTKNESENTPTQKTEPEAPLPGFFHFTVQRVTIFLKKSSRGTL